MYCLQCISVVALQRPTRSQDHRPHRDERSESGAPGFSLRRPALFRALYTYITRNFPPRMVLAAARSAAYWRLLGPSHPVKRHDVPSVHTLARRQPAMSLLPLGIRREHLRREHRGPLRAVPVERLTQLSRMWSGEQASQFCGVFVFSRIFDRASPFACASEGSGQRRASMPTEAGLFLLGSARRPNP